MNDEVSANAILKRATKHYTVMIKTQNSRIDLPLTDRRATVGHRISGRRLSRLQAFGRTWKSFLGLEIILSEGRNLLLQDEKSPYKMCLKHRILLPDFAIIVVYSIRVFCI